MLEVLAVAALVAQMPAVPALTSDWVTAPLQENEFGHFTRRAAKGPNEALVVSKVACQCQPSELFDELQAASANVRTAVVKQNFVQACDRTVDGVSRMNIDVYAYRTAGALVLIEYTYSKPHITAADETSMKAVCPASPAAAS